VPVPRDAEGKHVTVKIFQILIQIRELLRMSFRIFCAAVAGALYDLVDSTDENFDSATFGFYCITDILTQEPREESFSAFWDSWKISVSNHQHDAVRAIYQNTIDYDTPPRFHPLLPNRTVLQGFGWDHAIDL
jgi:hypothetical protein